MVESEGVEPSSKIDFALQLSWPWSMHRTIVSQVAFPLEAVSGVHRSMVRSHPIELPG